MVWFAKRNVLFCSTFMKRNKKIYSLFQLASAIFMILALLWLTISAPFVFASQQHLAKYEKSASANSSADNNEEETNNPLTNTTEEKAPTSSSSFSEEYLHDHHTTDFFFSIALQFHKCENADEYVAYHGELLVPPPNLA